MRWSLGSGGEGGGGKVEGVQHITSPPLNASSQRHTMLCKENRLGPPQPFLLCYGHCYARKKGVFPPFSFYSSQTTVFINKKITYFAKECDNAIATESVDHKKFLSTK